MKPAEFDSAIFERAGGVAVEFGAGDTVFLEGDSGKVMYFICSGEVELTSGGDTLASLWAGDIFGEMAMIDGSARSAEAIARSDVQTIAIDRSTFLAIVRETPEFAMHVLSILSVRVRELSCLI